MRALITGGEGFIGERLKYHLIIKYDWDVDIMDVKSGEDILSSMTFVTKENNYDYIFHLAAESRVQRSFNDPARTFKINTYGTALVAEKAMEIGAKLIYAGSSSKHHDPHSSPYACSKWLGEEVIKTYKKLGLNAEIARFYNVYGPGESLEDDGNVIGIWRGKSDRNQVCQIVGDGEQRRDFTYVDDIVTGLRKIASNRTPHEDAWELGLGINYSINELASIFTKEFGTKFEYVPDQAGNFRETLNTNKDAKERLDWHPCDQLKNHLHGLSDSNTKL